jgi:hypothetical protein
VENVKGETKGTLRAVFGSDVHIYDDELGRPFAFIEHSGQIPEDVQGKAQELGILLIQKIEIKKK